MFNNDEVVAIIPARGGSKRLPRKNVLPIGDKPCIAWTIEAAVNSKFIDHVVVSSDHGLIMFYPEVHRRVVHFLARGSFREETSEPVKSSSTPLTP